MLLITRSPVFELRQDTRIFKVTTLIEKQSLLVHFQKVVRSKYLTRDFSKISQKYILENLHGKSLRHITHHLKLLNIVLRGKGQTKTSEFMKSLNRSKHSTVKTYHALLFIQKQFKQFSNTRAWYSGLSKFHKLLVAVFKTSLKNTYMDSN